MLGACSGHVRGMLGACWECSIFELPSFKFPKNRRPQFELLRFRFGTSIFPKLKKKVSDLDQSEPSSRIFWRIFDFWIFDELIWISRMWILSVKGSAVDTSPTGSSGHSMPPGMPRGMPPGHVSQGLCHMFSPDSDAFEVFEVRNYKSSTFGKNGHLKHCLYISCEWYRNAYAWYTIYIYIYICM